MSMGEKRGFALEMAIKQARHVYFEVMGTECYACVTKKEARRLVTYDVEFGWDYMAWGDGDILIFTGYGR